MGMEMNFTRLQNFWRSMKEEHNADCVWGQVTPRNDKSIYHGDS